MVSASSRRRRRPLGRLRPPAPRRGAGKTLVGLRTVHAHYLDDLAIPREGGKPTAPAVFLSGNGPLVEVLQYEFQGADGGGKTFVRGGITVKSVRDLPLPPADQPDLFPIQQPPTTTTVGRRDVTETPPPTSGGGGLPDCPRSRDRDRRHAAQRIAAIGGADRHDFPVGWRDEDYVSTYSSKPGLVPPEHVLVFDEAQRAFDAEMVHAKHPEHGGHKSEPEHFIEFAERIPEWCVVIGLIGGGQEIHVGEEAGLAQWRWAVERTGHPDQWTVHAPLAVADIFDNSPVPLDLQPALNLDTELRFHMAKDLHGFVAALLDAKPTDTLRPMAERLESEGFHHADEHADAASDSLAH